jgi:hypothetical protein
MDTDGREERGAKAQRIEKKQDKKQAGCGDNRKVKLIRVSVYLELTGLNWS